MRKFLVTAMLLVICATPCFGIDWQGYKDIKPFVFLPTLTSVGGVVYDDVISGYKWGDWGIGVDYTIVVVDWKTVPIVKDWKWLHNVELGVADVILDSCDAKCYSAFYDLSHDVDSPVMFKIGLFAGLDANNPNHYVAGFGTRMGKLTLF